LRDVTRAAAVAAVLLSSLVAGCGGSESGESYTADATASCLSAKGADVDPDRENVDFIAVAAAEGAVRAQFEGHEVTVSFHRNSRDAKDAETSYRAFFYGQDVIAVLEADRVDRKGNAVIAWSTLPTGYQREAVEECIS
jgi:hypothetical protein